MDATSPNPANLRKAAVLLRSLDGETAAKLLAQLSGEEAAAVREAIRSLGEIDAVEQADLAAELRRSRASADRPAEVGVELNFSSLVPDSAISGEPTTSPELTPSKRFEFLESAPIETIAACLSREHVQTTAMVLSYLAPDRAAAILSALPPLCQADTLDRLSCLGEIDPESVSVVEHELATWVARQPTVRRSSVANHGAIQGILAAVDESTREEILVNLHKHNRRLAAELSHHARSNSAPCGDQDLSMRVRSSGPIAEPIGPGTESTFDSPSTPHRLATARSSPLRPPPLARRSLPRSRIGKPGVTVRFEDLGTWSQADFGELMRTIDPQLMVLALVGSDERLVDRCIGELSKQDAKAFRRKLRELGPTRLSDVEGAQRAVAKVAERCLARRSMQPPKHD